MKPGDHVWIIFHGGPPGTNVERGVVVEAVVEGFRGKRGGWWVQPIVHGGHHTERVPSQMYATREEAERVHALRVLSE